MTKAGAQHVSDNIMFVVKSSQNQYLLNKTIKMRSVQPFRTRYSSDQNLPKNNFSRENQSGHANPVPSFEVVSPVVGH